MTLKSVQNLLEPAAPTHFIDDRHKACHQPHAPGAGGAVDRSHNSPAIASLNMVCDMTSTFTAALLGYLTPGTGAVVCLSGNHATNRTRLGLAGAGEAVVAAMKAHRGHGVVQ